MKGSNAMSDRNCSNNNNCNNNGNNCSNLSLIHILLISMRQLTAAETMLASLPQNAEWNYLMGIICLNRGWYSRAKEYIDRAVSLDPQNSEYRAAQGNFSSRAGSFRTYGTKISPLACCFTSLCCSNLFYRGCFCCY